MINLYPLKFKAIFKEKLWGGRNLEILLGKPLPPAQKIGESWEICDRGLDQSTVANGLWTGRTLHELMNLLKEDLLGDHFSTFPERFPLLFKIIDAQDDLSLQVHPDDDYAALHEKEDPGKTEMWYVWHCEKNARMTCGFQKKIALKSLRDKLQNQGNLDFLKTYPSKAGEAFFVPAGTVHALGKGNVVIEIQENSDLTYRLSDWGRLDIRGKARPLHLEKGLEVIKIEEGNHLIHPHQEGSQETPLVECPYFKVWFETFSGSFDTTIPPQSFQVWIILEGKGSVKNEPLKKGDFILIPARIGKLSVKLSSPLRILKTTMGNKNSW